MKVVTILSGGMDSTALLYWLLSKGHEVKALGINYGQKHSKELASAVRISREIGVEFRLVDLSGLRDLLNNSSQTSLDIAVPHGHYAAENMKATVVPNRNMIMLAVAAGWAVNEKFEVVAYAAHAGDHTIYPDCRPEFVQALGGAMKLCHFEPVVLLAPFIVMSKTDIVRLGADLKVPFELTWSCYEGGDIHCGLCGTCVERKEAFAQAKIKDPTHYVA